MKTVFTCFSTDVIHEGHMNIINQAKKYGRVIVGCLSDKEMIRCTKFPTTSEKERLSLYASLEGVDDVILQDDMLYNDIIEKLHPDIIIHGDNWRYGAEKAVRGRKWDMRREIPGEGRAERTRRERRKDMHL